LGAITHLEKNFYHRGGGGRAGVTVKKNLEDWPDNAPAKGSGTQGCVICPKEKLSEKGGGKERRKGNEAKIQGDEVERGAGEGPRRIKTKQNPDEVIGGGKGGGGGTEEGQGPCSGSGARTKRKEPSSGGRRKRKKRMQEGGCKSLHWGKKKTQGQRRRNGQKHQSCKRQ